MLLAQCGSTRLPGGQGLWELAVSKAASKARTPYHLPQVSQVSHASIAHISCLVCVCQSLPRTLPPQSTHESTPATRDRNAALSQCIE